jgi:hypothetical protein
MGRNISVIIGTGCGLDGRGYVPGWGKTFCSTASIPALGDTQDPTRWVPAADFSGVKEPDHEADYSPPSIAEASSVGAIPPCHHTSTWRGAQLTNHRDKLRLATILGRA